MTSVRQNSVSNALRVILVCAVVACIYYLWAGQPTVSWAIAIGIFCVSLARLVVKSKLLPNPLGEGDRDYSMRPVMWGIVKGSVCVLAAFVWGIGCVLAVHYLVLPDTALVNYGLMGVPFVALILTGAWFIIGSGVQAVYGRTKK